jgi:hypothetical protein
MPVRKALLQTTMLAGIVGAVYFSASSARAADTIPLKAPPYLPAPAVDYVNGKIDAFGGSLANRSIFGSKGALSVPLGGQWGAQIDGAVGSFDSRAFGAVAGHLFWRNPSQVLLGIYASHTYWDQFGGLHVSQVAGEGEYYLGNWTLQGIAGVEFGNSRSNITATAIDTYDIQTRFFDQINLKYYLIDNWNAYVGHRYLGGKNALALGTEYALPLGRGLMASGFIEGRVGEDDFHGIWGGLRFYFGQKDKTLIARHRQDDPNVWSLDTLFSIINNQSFEGAPSPPAPDLCISC